ncbi:uncharacterized protein ACBR49_020513 [Aulostomus maculatus]
MTILLFGVILGLFATVQSTTVNTVTQIPSKSEDDVFREALTDGFLVENLFIPSLTTRSPQTTTVQSSSESDEGLAASGSGDEFLRNERENVATTSPSSTSAVLQSDATETLLSNFSSPPVPNEDQSNVTADLSSVSKNAHLSFTDLSMLSSSSGDGEAPDQPPSTPSSSFSSSTETASSTTGRQIPREEGLGLEIIEETIQTQIVQKNSAVQPTPRHIVQPNAEDKSQHKGHFTPDWIIIVGFIVGVAALIMLCVAIATRDKWNRPNQASKKEGKPSHQQREVEMETFIHRDAPRENGKASEYTVIPLDELPETYSH